MPVQVQEQRRRQTGGFYIGKMDAVIQATQSEKDLEVLKRTLKDKNLITDADLTNSETKLKAQGKLK